LNQAKERKANAKKSEMLSGKQQLWHQHSCINDIQWQDNQIHKKNDGPHFPVSEKIGKRIKNRIKQREEAPIKHFNFIGRPDKSVIIVFHIKIFQLIKAILNRNGDEINSTNRAALSMKS
jgi:hypothetical protein